MTTASLEQEVFLGLDSAGVMMTPEEFDAIGEDEYDENYRYELINGVVVVSPLPSPEETGPNELLGHYLLLYKETHRRGKSLDWTLPQQYVFLKRTRRIADRLIWTGLGRQPNRRSDLPSIAVEFVSRGRRSQKRDYVDKRKDYSKAGIKEYWIIDRFQRTMTVIRYKSTGEEVIVIRDNETYEPPFLPGFKVPLADILAAADRIAASEE